MLPAAADPQSYRVAVVCLGNICRSPMAHVVLAARIADAGLADRVHLESFGTGDWHVGQPMDRRAAAALDRRGVRRHPPPRPPVHRPRGRGLRPGAGHGPRQRG